LTQRERKAYRMPGSRCQFQRGQAAPIRARLPQGNQEEHRRDQGWPSRTQRGSDTSRKPSRLAPAASAPPGLGTRLVSVLHQPIPDDASPGRNRQGTSVAAPAAQPAAAGRTKRPGSDVQVEKAAEQEAQNLALPSDPLAWLLWWHDTRRGTRCLAT
jgi:hypothetical protein